jgi:predicted dehydrogenase
MLEVGILGAGFMSSTHAAAYQNLPNVHIAAIADTDKDKVEKLAQQFGCRADTQAENIIHDKSIALLDVSLPTPLHAKYAILGMEAGKHVVVEKPMALSLAETDEMLQVYHRTGKFLMVAHVLRFWPEYVKIREVLQNGKLGDPISATSYRLSNPPQWAVWFLDPKLSGGTVLDLAIHDLDMMNWLFGGLRSVFASGAGEKNGDWGHVLIQGNHGRVITSVEASFRMPKDFPFAAGLRVLCENGMLDYRFQAGGASIEQGQPVNTLMLHEPERPNQLLAVEAGDAYEREIAYFVKCVQTNHAPTLVPPEEARMAVQTALAARRSIESGKPVEL